MKIPAIYKPLVKKSQTFSEVDYFSFWQCFTSVLLAVSFIIQEWYLFFLLTGILNMLIVLNYVRRSVLTKSWTKVKGIYQLFRLDTINIQRCNRGGPDVRYRPYCSYSYIVNDVKYDSDRLSIVNNDYESDSAVGDDLKIVIKRDIKTKTVAVFINPKDPNKSVLVKEISKWKILGIYFIGFLSLLQIVLASYRLLT